MVPQPTPEVPLSISFHCDPTHCATVTNPSWLSELGAMTVARAHALSLVACLISETTTATVGLLAFAYVMTAWTSTVSVAAQPPGTADLMGLSGLIVVCATYGGVMSSGMDDDVVVA